MNGLRSLALILCIALSGCASVTDMKKDLSSKNLSITSYSEMNYQTLKTANAVTVNFDKQSPAYQFDEGKSFYSAFSIPEPRLPRKLKVKSYVSPTYSEGANVFVPNFLFLAEDKKPISTTKNYRPHSDTDFFLGPYLDGTVVIPAEAAYMVIYTPENGHEWTMTNAPSGKLSLELSNTFPIDHDFSTVIIKDSVKVYSDSKDDFFYVDKINNNTVENSLVKTRIANDGRGMSMSPTLIDRETPVEPSTLNIVGRTEYAAPILAFTNTVYEVKGQVKFIPEKNRTYIVQGTLGEDYCAVWVEDEESHKIMGDKIEIHGSAKLGILSK